MRPGQAVAQVLRRSLEFRGRSQRAEYWWWALFNVLLQIAAEVTDSFLSLPVYFGSGVLSLIILALVTIPDTAVGWRRLQDSGIPGWIYAVFTVFTFSFLFVPTDVSGDYIGADPVATTLDIGLSFAYLYALGLILASLIMIILLVRKSQTGDNRYGPNPIGIGNSNVFD